MLVLPSWLRWMEALASHTQILYLGSGVIWGPMSDVWSVEAATFFGGTARPHMRTMVVVYLHKHGVNVGKYASTMDPTCFPWTVIFHIAVLNYHIYQVKPDRVCHRAQTAVVVVEHVPGFWSRTEKSPQHLWWNMNFGPEKSIQINPSDSKLCMISILDHFSWSNLVWLQMVTICRFF